MVGSLAAILHLGKPFMSGGSIDRRENKRGLILSALVGRRLVQSGVKSWYRHRRIYLRLLIDKPRVCSRLISSCKACHLDGVWNLGLRGWGRSLSEGKGVSWGFLGEGLRDHGFLVNRRAAIGA